MRNKLLGMAITTIAGISLTACGGSGSTSAEPVTTPSSTPTVDVLHVVNSSLGPIVGDANGRTLYAFTKDTGGTSTCYDACAAAWPAALATDTDLSATGINNGLIGTTIRNDGSKQLTLNGMPLYRFAADGDASGQLKGQANKGVWFVVNSSGALVRDAANASTTNPPTTYKY